MTSVQTAETKGRTAGGTEHNWCKALRDGTGIAITHYRKPRRFPFQNCNPQTTKYPSYPQIKAPFQHRLHFFSFVTSPTPFINIESHSLSVTSEILGRIGNDTFSPFQQILEHELNKNTWQQDKDSSTNSEKQNVSDVLVASIYGMPDATWAAVMRLHVTTCDRTTTVSLLRELLVVMEEEKGVQRSCRGRMN